MDIIVEMHADSRRPVDRRRRLRAFSRHAATPPNLVIEWTAEGTDYRNLGALGEPEFEHAWPVLRTILEESEKSLTRRDILRRWPDACIAPAKHTLWKWLGRAVQEHGVLQDGLGTRNDPFRYALPGMAEKWQAKFLESFMKKLEQGARRRPNSSP